MIRPAVMADLSAVLAVYAAARATMRARGNPTQWGSTYPERQLLEQDIQRGQLYVLQEAGAVHGAFAFIPGEDPTYSHIEDGAWLDGSPYAAIHRVAGDGVVRGVFAQCLAYCQARCGHLRIDTHQDNLAMQHLVKKHGFQYCGVIYTDDGSPRLAYEWTQHA